MNLAEKTPRCGVLCLHLVEYFLITPWRPLSLGYYSYGLLTPSSNADSPQVQPDLFALQVRLQAGLGVAPEVGNIEALDGDAQLLSQQLHGHLTGQLLQSRHKPPADKERRNREERKRERKEGLG